MTLYNDQEDNSGKQSTTAVHEPHYNRMVEGVVECEAALQHLKRVSGSEGDDARPFVASSGLVGQTTPAISADQSPSFSKPKAPSPVQNVSQLSPETADLLAENIDRFSSRPERLGPVQPTHTQSEYGLYNPEVFMVPSSEADIGDHALRNYQKQKQYEMDLARLESENRMRLRRARGEQLIEDSPSANTQADDQVKEMTQEAPVTHYTISEDKTASSGHRNSLYAIKAETRSNLSQPAMATSSRLQEPWCQHQNPDAHRLLDYQAQQSLLQGVDATALSRARGESLQPHEDTGVSAFTSPRLNHNVQTKFKEPSRDEEIFSERPIPNSQSADHGIAGEGLFENSGISPWANQPEQANLLQMMMQRIRQLEDENKKLRPGKPTAQPEDIAPPNVQVFHRLLDSGNNTIYLSEPDWEVSQKTVILRGRLPIQDHKGYVKHKGNVMFTIYKCYSVDYQQGDIDKALRDRRPLPKPTPASHQIVLDSNEMKQAVRDLFDQWPSFRTDYPEVREEGTLHSPFIWWYHHRRSNNIGQLPTPQARLVSTLTEWIEANYATLYDRIDEQFGRSRVSHRSVEYLVRPGDVLVSATKEGPLGYVAMSRPQRLFDSSNKDEQKRVFWAVQVRSYIYAGNFLRKDGMIRLELGSESETEEEVDIRSLIAMPLRFASRENCDVLVKRAKTFWKIRNRRLMSYLGHHATRKYAGQRFMIDFTTYQELHPDNSYLKMMNSCSGADSTQLANDGAEPEAPEIYLFPLHVPGFDFRRKGWVDLEVDQLRDVTWNDQAFRSLVAEDDMKQVILALVTNQLDADQGTDLIDNKGNGLIMLLHGSPGTGKTFTAESVAEIAKKPLYPVTCGDIGTQPADVERYLNSVFHLGEMWDCVVLLDEAEVFLEQRTLQDLNRNALVSVFLRALEYHEGILILTTNRVGTFDEAFKSRIQLSLRYERLQRHQRKQIWLNFMSHLKELGEQERIDFNNIELNIDELAEYPMNGRQIRNSITTGRQLAKYQQVKMAFSHLKRTIILAGRFDKYLGNVREGVQEKETDRGVDAMSLDDYWARAEMTR